ncbi:MAG: thioesterase family protein [Nocardioidaceae bacterium]
MPLISAATLHFTVGDADTAISVGSGDLPVLATPRLLAWCEAATCVAVHGQVPAGSATVGTRIVLEHLAASAVGRELTVTASLVHTDGRLLRFEVVATHSAGPDAGTVVCHGEVTRVAVDRQRFMTRLN